MDRFFLENFVFEFDDDLFENSLLLFTKEAQDIVEINDKVYFNYYPQKRRGLQLVVEGKRDKDNNIEIMDFFVHHTSADIWDFAIVTKVNKDDENTLVVTNKDSEGLACIRLVNKDVLGDIKHDDVIQAQVVALALNVEIYENEEQYRDDNKYKDGEDTYLVGEGQIFPINYLINNSADLSQEEREQKDHHFDNIVTIKGTIESANKFGLNMYNIDLNSYYTAHINTSFGDLDIIIPHDVLPKNIDGFGAGNVIVAEALLSGDVCINEYDKYIRKK